MVASGMPLGSDVMTKKITSADLKKMLKNREGNALVLFQGDWCPDCRAFKPAWELWCRDRSGPIFSIEVLRGAAEWKEWDIDEIPTVAVYCSGSEKDRVHGNITDEDLERLWKQVR